MTDQLQNHRRVPSAHREIMALPTNFRINDVNIVPSAQGEIMTLPTNFRINDVNIVPSAQGEIMTDQLQNQRR